MSNYLIALKTFGKNDKILSLHLKLSTILKVDPPPLLKKKYFILIGLLVLLNMKMKIKQSNK